MPRHEKQIIEKCCFNRLAVHKTKRLFKSHIKSKKCQSLIEKINLYEGNCERYYKTDVEFKM